MRLNIIKFLIVINFTVFLISLIIIFSRYTLLTSPKEKLQVEDISRQTPPKQQLQVSSEKDTTSLSLQKDTSIPQQQDITTELKLRKPKFVYFSSKAKKVELIGDFNEWVPQPMKKVAPNKWELVIEIPEGKYLYNFIVDNNRILDPNNKKPPELSPLGFKSSVLELK